MQKITGRVSEKIRDTDDCQNLRRCDKMETNVLMLRWDYLVNKAYK